MCHTYKRERDNESGKGAPLYLKFQFFYLSWTCACVCSSQLIHPGVVLNLMYTCMEICWMYVEIWMIWFGLVASLGPRATTKICKVRGGGADGGGEVVVVVTLFIDHLQYPGTDKGQLERKNHSTLLNFNKNKLKENFFFY